MTLLLPPADDPAAFTCLPDTAAATASPLSVCCNHRPGHTAHGIQLGLAERSPWFWRAGVVTAVVGAAGGRVFAVAWVEDEDPLVRELDGPSDGPVGSEVTCWQHGAAPELCVGYPVRIHTEFGVIETGAGWSSVLVSRDAANGGGGPDMMGP